MSNKAEKKNKGNGHTGPPKGSEENPHLLDSLWVDLSELQEGVSVIYVVQSKSRDDKREEWEDEDAEKTPEAAFRFIKKSIKDSMGWAKENQEREYWQSNPDRQKAQFVQFKVTKKTTKKEIVEWTEQLEAERERMRSKESAKPFKFDKKAAEESLGEFRVVKRIVGVINEIVEAE